MAHEKLLENPQVKRWYDNISRASELTAEVDLRRLGLFCNKWRLTPAGLLQKDPQEIHSLLVDTVTELEKEGYHVICEGCGVSPTRSDRRARSGTCQLGVLDMKSLLEFGVANIPAEALEKALSPPS